MVWGRAHVCIFPLENVHSTCTWTLLLSPPYFKPICLVTYVVIRGARVARMPRVLIGQVLGVFVRSNVHGPALVEPHCFL